jgi:hypothetical protein
LNIEQGLKIYDLGIIVAVLKSKIPACRQAGQAGLILVLTSIPPSHIADNT